jgi:poly [ADP-ribose] polymerase
MKFILNMKEIEKAVMEIGYDPKKMPLGSLSDETINSGYKILQQIETAIKNKAS